MSSAVYRRIRDSGALPSPAGVAFELWNLARDPDASAREMTALLERDPATAARILKFANSAFVGLPNRIGDLHRAVVLLGARTVVNLSLGLSLITANQRGACKMFDFEQFWSEAAVRAAAARHLARPPLSSSEAFSCGLLSQIGKLALATVFPAQYSEVLEHCAAHRMARLVEIERKMFEIDHHQLTAEMMADWNLPEYFCAAVLAQDAPHKANLEQRPDAAMLAALLHLGGLIAPLFEMLNVRREYLVNLMAAAHRMHIPRDEVPDMVDAVSRDWQRSGEILPVRTHPIPKWQEMYARTAPGTASGHALVGAGAGSTTPRKARDTARWFLGD